MSRSFFSRHRAIEKPKVDHARLLRGICLIDPDDMEFKDTMKNARKKLEVPQESTSPFMALSITMHGEICCGTKTDNWKTRYLCVVEARAFMRLIKEIMSTRLFLSSRQ